MSKHKKNFLLTAVCLVSLFLLVSICLKTLILNDFAAIEKKETIDNANRAQNLINNTVKDLSTKLSDWSTWDDTYAYIQNKSQKYVTSNLVDESLAQLNIDMMIFIDDKGQIVKVKTVNQDTETADTLPAGLEPYLKTNSVLLQHPDVTAAQSGVILLPSQPMLVVSRPILKSDGTGPAKGTLVFGSYLDEKRISAYERTSYLTIKLYRLDDSTLSPEVVSAQDELNTQSIVVKPTSDEEIATYSQIKDINGKPVVILQTVSSRTIYTEGKNSVKEYMYTVAGGFIFVLIAYYFLSKYLVFRSKATA